MSLRLVLTPPLRAQLETEARAAFPRECCGLIEGKRTDETLEVRALHPARNLAEAPDRFEIDPAAQFKLLHALRDTGREIIGCYHSHPNGRAEPSPRDGENPGEEGFVWLIAGLSVKGGPVALAAFSAPDMAPLELLARAPL